MVWNAVADNNRVANPVADTGRQVFCSILGASGVEIAQRYLSIEQYRPGNRLQLDSRISALLDAAADYREKRGVHIVYQQTLRRCLASAGLGRQSRGR